MPELTDSDVDTRNDLFGVGLMEESYKFAKKKLEADPENIDKMAFFGQTALEYEKTKNPIMKTHWIDRMDVLHEGLEITHKCMEKDPEALQCQRYFVLLALKAAGQQFFNKEFANIGIMHNYTRIVNRGEALLKKKFFPDVGLAIATLHAQVARKWYNPYRWVQRFVYGIPDEDVLYQKAIDLHLEVMKHLPDKMENVVRLGQACLLKGEDAAARKYFSKVRNEMIKKEKSDDIWVAMAATALVSRFPVDGKGYQKSHKYNLPIG